MPFILDRFLRKWNLDAARLAAASGIDEGIVSRLRSGKRLANVAHIERLVEGARVMLKRKNIDASDFIFVDGGEVKEGESAGRKRRFGPYGEVRGGSLSEIIKGYVGRNGEQIVPLMVDIAQDNVTEEVKPKDGGRSRRVRVPQKAIDQRDAIKWLTEHGDFRTLEQGGGLEIKLTLIDERENLVGEHKLIFSGAADKPSSSVPPEGVPAGVLAGSLSGGEDEAGEGLP